MNSARPVIAHVNLASGFRGGERQTSLLIGALAAMGYRQRLVARRAAPLVERCAGIDGLERVAVASNPLAAGLAARRADLLHAHEARAVYACWLGSAVGRLPWLLTRRVDNPFKASFLRDRAYRRASCLVGVSRAVARRIEAQYPQTRCVVVPDAHADLARGHRTPDALARGYAGRTVVGHIGALDHRQKGQGTIIAAARLARERHPELTFVLLGEGRDEQAMRKAAADLPNVEFTGYVADVADWLSVFDLFVFPSRQEGLGSSLLDAMNFGLPIVATDVGGIPEIVEDGVNGLLIPPEDARALLAALEKLLGDAPLRERMRRANRRKAEAYSPRRMAARYAALYDKLLA